jgi:hypothetical protein
MTSDVKLSDDAVLVDGNLGIGVAIPMRPLHVEGNEIHSGGTYAGYSFNDRGVAGFSDNPGERWVWYAKKGHAYLWSGNDLVNVGLNGAVEANSFTSSGAGFIFSDRNPLAGGWCWYAQNGKARLSVDPVGDVLDVDATNGLHVRRLHVDGAVGANSVNANSFHAGLLVALDQSGLAVGDGVGTNPTFATRL